MPLPIIETAAPVLLPFPPAPSAHGPSGSPAWSIATALKVAAAVAAAVLLLWLLWSVALLLFFAILLAATLRGTADWLSLRTGVRATWMLALVSLVLVAIAVGFVLAIGPSLAQQGGDLFDSVTKELHTLQDKYGQTRWGKRIAEHLQPGGGVPGSMAAPAMRVLGVSLDLVASLVLLVITALYLAASPHTYINGALRLVPIRHRARGREILHETGRTLRRWLLGQVLDMLVVAVLTALGLSLLGVPVPLALGALAGLLTFIPYFGAFMAGVPAVLVAFSVSPHLALLTLGVFLGVHLIEGYMISPLIQKRMVELPPAITVMAMTVSGTLFGPIGIILGTPLAAACMVLVRELYVVDALGDREVADRD
ncbi:AI-2E family transporter [Lichenicola sp.]|uniref:AI-2E family transporter n=1 Tax=Lichenicola sp. TaxID=2804529 RepID=UPI003B00B126